jgi:hypothetical protein
MDDITSTTDRYTTFAGIDCAGNSLRLVQAIRRHIDDPAKTNKFWEAFKVKLAHAELEPVKRKADQLCLLCSHVCTWTSCSRSTTTRRGWSCLGFWKSSAADRVPVYSPSTSVRALGATAPPASSPA